MYHPKGHNLLEHAPELKKMGLNFLRFDLRSEESIPLLEKSVQFSEMELICPM